MLGVGAGQTLSAAFTPTSTANYNTASRTVQITVTGTPTTGHNAARANSYDDAWQGGATGWVANAKAILAGGTGQTPGLVLWIGDSLTRDPALGAWAQSGAGKTAEDQMITTWMHAGLSPQSIDSIDGFALATPYFCSARSYTVGDSLGAWDFMGGSMPADTNPATARQKLQNCTAYPSALNLYTMLAALPKAQFAIPEVNLEASNPASFTDFERMVDLMISNGIVPIIMTYTYRNGCGIQPARRSIQHGAGRVCPVEEAAVDRLEQGNARPSAVRAVARAIPVGDGVHYTRGTTTYPATSDPYAQRRRSGDAHDRPGADLQRVWPEGLARRAEDEGDQAAGHRRRDARSDGHDERLARLDHVRGGVDAELVEHERDDRSINQGIGAVAASGTRSVSPTATTTYTVTATNAAGSVTATATVTVTATTRCRRSR